MNQELNDETILADVETNAEVMHATDDPQFFQALYARENTESAQSVADM